MKKIGILGGTFDPPHLGHLIMAEFSLEEMNLDEIWFMPSFIPPHKQESSTDPDARLMMVKKAINQHPEFKMCDVELVRKGTSYTVDTMAFLKGEYPDVHFYFIIGGDMVEHLPKWQRIEDLVELVDFIGVQRPGFGWNKAIPVQFVDIPSIEVSSTMIRKRISEGKSVRYLVPENVDSFIKEHHLYGNDS